MFDFPNSPTLNQVVLGKTGAVYVWDGVKWVASGGGTGVISFNARSGAVTLNNADVTTVLPPSSTMPVMDGTAAIGVGTTWARADHVHPASPMIGASKVFLNTTAVGNGANTTEDDAQTGTIAAGVWTSGWLEIEAQGTFVASTNSKTVKLYVGGTVVASMTTVGSTIAAWKLRARAALIDSTHFTAVSDGWVQLVGLATPAPTLIGQTALNIPVANTGTTPCIVKTTCQNSTAATANTVVSSVLSCALFP